MQRGLPLWFMTFVFGVGAVATACGGSTEPADAPASAPAGEGASATPEQEQAEPSGDAAGRGVDVGMEFGGDEEEEEPVQSHEPPPTGTWQPTNKQELAPKKPDDAAKK
jgi:hypothetical protein